MDFSALLKKNSRKPVICSVSCKEDFDSKVQLIGEQYGTIKEMMGAVAEDMQVVKSDIEFIKSSLHKKVDYDEFSALEKRVTLLEAKTRK